VKNSGGTGGKKKEKPPLKKRRGRGKADLLWSPIDLITGSSAVKTIDKGGLKRKPP